MINKLDPPYFVALDIDDIDRLRKLATGVAPYVGGFKIGPRLCMRYGPGLIKDLSALKPVFVDNKYFDIPSTMEAAVSATFAAGASFTTVHAQAGEEALRRLAAMEREFAAKRPFKIFVVTILTSFSQDSLPPNSSAMPIRDQVNHLADLAMHCGLTGLVCSADETYTLRQRHPDSYLVVPGIRLPGQGLGDQSRVADPQTALSFGASALVVGRPIIEAKDPVAAAGLFQKACRHEG